MKKSKTKMCSYRFNVAMMKELKVITNKRRWKMTTMLDYLIEMFLKGKVDEGSSYERI